MVPVYDGFVPQNLIRRLDVAGRHVTQVGVGCIHMMMMILMIYRIHILLTYHLI